MTELFLPQTQQTITDFKDIQSFLKKQKVNLERWQAQFLLKESDDQDTILKAYAHELQPFMKANGFLTADVINVHSQTPNLPQLRQKFLQEHTHSEDEVRFFVDGSGVFWFHFDNDVVARLTCCRGDFLAVPSGFRHWFDLAPGYFVKAIRIFSNKDGWVAQYTGSGIDARYNQVQS